MKKIISLISVVILYWSTIQTGFAEENSDGALVKIGTETKAIAFNNPDKTAKIDIPPDHTHKSVPISLLAGSTREIMLTSCKCDNQHITANQSANCSVSPLFPTTLTLIDESHWTNTQKNAISVGLLGGLANLALALELAPGEDVLVDFIVAGVTCGTASGTVMGAIVGKLQDWGVI